MSPENLTITSLGGCIVHDVAKMLEDDDISILHHYWRRPTIALMSEPVSRSRYKLHDVPAPFVNYFVNDLSKLHRSEIESLENKSVVLFDITRDLFTGVLDLGNGCYVMNAVDGIGIVDGLSNETMSHEIVSGVLGGDIKEIGYNIDADQFFEIWQAHFLKLLEFLNENFTRVILVELYFTDRLIGGGQQKTLTEVAENGNQMLERMYAFAREQGVDVLGLEREAYVTGHFVAWGGPSLTHYVPETTMRLAGALKAHLGFEAEGEAGLVEQAYKRAGDFEQTMIWLNEEKAKLAEARALLEAERSRWVSDQVLIAKELQSVIESVGLINSRI